jgi:adenosylcobinamide-GDP ribazoletransferase
LSFLTRIPVPRRIGRAEDLARSVPWFPVVGVVVAVVVAGVYSIGLRLWPNLLAGIVAVGAGAIVTGAFHEDGLADTLDAFGAWTPERARAILKDPTHGSFGVIAMILTIAVRITALATLGAAQALATLVTAHATGRAAAVVTMRAAPVATEEGLGAAYAARVTNRQAAVAASLAVGIAVLAMLQWGLVSCAIVALAAWATARLAIAKIGGITGDVLGAIEQVSECAVLLLASALVFKGWSDVAWWR